MSAVRRTLQSVFKATAVEFRLVQRNPKVSFHITGRGNVDRVQLLQGSGSPDLDNRLIGWLRLMRLQVKHGCEMPWRGTGVVYVEF